MNKMTELLMFLQIVMMILFIIYLFNSNKASHSKNTVVDRENKKEMENLLKLRSIKLTEPLTEKKQAIIF